jgi:hypothetical protein
VATLVARSAAITIPAAQQQAQARAHQPGVGARGLQTLPAHSAHRGILKSLIFQRSVTAPPFIACTAVGISASPVMKTIGFLIPGAGNACCSSSPFMPGMHTSVTRSTRVTNRKSLQLGNCALCRALLPWRWYGSARGYDQSLMPGGHCTDILSVTIGRAVCNRRRAHEIERRPRNRAAALRSVREP